MIPGCLGCNDGTSPTELYHSIVENLNPLLGVVQIEGFKRTKKPKKNHCKMVLSLNCFI